MTPNYPVALDEPERLAALRALDLLDTPREDRFDRITRIAQRLVHTPISLITLVDTDRQWFKSCQGLGISETPRSASFCAHAIASDDIFVVPDAQLDPRFVDNPLVTGPPYIRFYAGAPLHSPARFRVGTLCVIDSQPRQLSADDAAALTDLSVWAELEFNVVRMSRAAQERDRLRVQLETIGDSLAQGLCLLDPDQRILGTNRAMSEMFGRPTGELAGARLADLLDVGSSAFALPVPGETPARVRGADGAALEVSVTTAPLQNDPAGSVVALVADVSAQRAVERLKDEIISVTGHELRTPLTAIRGSLGLLDAGLGGTLDDSGRRLIETATRNADRLIRLVNDMLDIERLAAGRMPMDSEPVDLAEVAAAAVEGLGEIAATDHVTISVDAESAPTTGDRDRLIQVVTNLLHNAVKFSPAESTVSVRVRGDAGNGVVSLAVCDEGRGMEPAEAEQIFERFTQLDTGANRSIGGSGLGLAIVRGLVTAHDGTVEVESAPGAGSTFTVCLPARNEPA